MRCGECGRSIIASIAKGHNYYYCTRYHNKCSQKSYVREEDLGKQILGILGNLEISEKIAEWIKRALKNSHAAETEYHVQSLETLDREYQMIQKRVDALYDDKLDEKITEELFYQRKFDQHQGQMNAILNQKNRHQSAGVDYYELGTSILELSRKAVNTYFSRSNAEKRQLLQIVLSNLSLKDGNLSPVYHPAFQVLAEKVKNEVWLGEVDSNHHKQIQSLLSYR